MILPDPARGCSLLQPRKPRPVECIVKPDTLPRSLVLVGLGSPYSHPLLALQHYPFLPTQVSQALVSLTRSLVVVGLVFLVYTRKNP